MVGCPAQLPLTSDRSNPLFIGHACRSPAQLTCGCACGRFGVVRKHAHVIVEDSKIAEVLGSAFNYV